MGEIFYFLFAKSFIFLLRFTSDVILLSLSKNELIKEVNREPS